MSKQHKPAPTPSDQRAGADILDAEYAGGDELFRIEQVAELTGMTKRTLRYYEERGLLDPPTRTEGNYRLYSQADLDHIKRVKRIRELLGASLAEIKEMVEGEEARQTFRDAWAQNPDPLARIALLERGEAVVRRQLSVVRARLAELTNLESALSDKLRRYDLRRDEIRAQSGLDEAALSPMSSSSEQ